MYRLRNRISHEYFGIDYEILWDIATRHLANNYLDLQIVIEELGKNKPQNLNC